MSIRFAAPYPAVQTFIHLPNPQFGNSEASVGTAEYKHSINNTRYSYIKVKDSRRKLLINFDVTQAKGTELLEFIRSYHGMLVQYRDELEQRWLGYFITNPNQIETHNLAVKDDTAKYAYVNIQIEFEGILQA